MLEIRGLTKYYRNTPVVNNVSFTLKPGEVTGYLGPNGSGKSTTVKIITALIEPSAGKVLLDGKDIRDDLIAFKRRLGYVPEEAILYSYLTGLEYLQLMGCLRSMPPREVERKANDLLELFQLHSYRHAPISAYSKGMKQRILISAALLGDPDVLILDEPLSGIDVTSALLFKHLLGELARRGKAILYISHVLEVVEKVCAQVIIIYRGRIMAADSVEHLRDLDKSAFAGRNFLPTGGTPRPGSRGARHRLRHREVIEFERCIFTEETQRTQREAQRKRFED